MRQRCSLVLVALAAGGLLALAPVSLAAQSVRTLTLEEVLGQVEAVNLAVLTSREFITQAEENARRSRSSLLPQLDGRASQSRSDRGDTARADSFQAGLFGTLTILDLRQHETLRAARQAIRVSQHDFDNAVQSVLTAVAGLYFTHLRDLAFDDVIDSNIERAEVLLRLARNQLDAGVATQIDVTRAEAELVTQQQAKLQQETVIVDSALRIKRLLNLELGTDLVLEDFRVRRDLDAGLRALALDGVLERRADYLAQAAALDQVRIERRAAGRERAPTVDVFAQGGVASEVILDGDEEEFWSAGVQLNVPVFEGNRIRATERIAESRMRQEEFRLADLRNVIGTELRIALQDVGSQLAQIVVAEKNLALAEEELRLARVRYEQGVADNRELIDAENRFTRSSFNLVGAIFNYHVARLELARVRGDVRLILTERVR